MGFMATLKVEGDDELIEKFKRKARRKHGDRRGSIKKATMELIEKWVRQEEDENVWEELAGTIESEKSSVELEEEMWENVD